MTVKELINRLQQISNQEMTVVVDGYEGGFDDIKEQNLSLFIKELIINGMMENMSKVFLDKVAMLCYSCLDEKESFIYYNWSFWSR